LRRQIQHIRKDKISHHFFRQIGRWVDAVVEVLHCDGIELGSLNDGHIKAGAIAVANFSYLIVAIIFLGPGFLAADTLKSRNTLTNSAGRVGNAGSAILADKRLTGIQHDIAIHPGKTFRAITQSVNTNAAIFANNPRAGLFAGSSEKQGKQNEREDYQVLLHMGNVWEAERLCLIM
jgi:hypothetical protein